MSGTNDTNHGDVFVAKTARPLQERVYHARVSIFFGHAVGNMAMAILGAMLISLVLYKADVPIQRIGIWIGAAFALSAVVAFIEHQFKSAALSAETIKIWVRRRAIFGIAVASTYGISPFLFSVDAPLLSELFLFIILSCLVAVAATGYSVMPFYYVALNGVTLVPYTIYLLMQPDYVHVILAITVVIWQVMVLIKALGVSKSSIRAIELNELLRDEVEQHKRTREEMRNLAYHDELTGLANRRHFIEAAGRKISSNRRSMGKLGFIMIDLNNFKTINDTHGHDAGDLVLRKVAEGLKGAVRNEDLAARLGGDEFCVIAENLNSVDELNVIASKLSTVLKQTIRFAGHDLMVSGSIGTAMFPDHGEEIDLLLRRADQAMYDRKNESKAGI